jgi:hypothetical protein
VTGPEKLPAALASGSWKFQYPDRRRHFLVSRKAATKLTVLR